jgi:hypothetical protein
MAGIFTLVLLYGRILGPQKFFDEDRLPFNLCYFFDIFLKSKKLRKLCFIKADLQNCAIKIYLWNAIREVRSRNV